MYNIVTIPSEYCSEDDIDNIDNITCSHIKMAIHMSSQIYMGRKYNTSLRPPRCFTSDELIEFGLLEKKIKSLLGILNTHTK